MKNRKRTLGQSGQIVVIGVLAAAVLLGAAALATDLGIASQARRDIQNGTDSAALAGARDLFPGQTAAVQQQAVTDAETGLSKDFGWSGFTATVPTVLGSGYAVTGVTFASSPGSCPGKPGCYTFSIQTPPANSSGCPTPTLCVEVNLHSWTQNSLGNFVGFGSTSEGSRSVAYHTGPPQAFGFALYSADGIEAGAQGELIDGPVYGRWLVAQSSGVSSSLCVAPDPSDPNSGYAILGFPQFPDDGGATTDQNNPPASSSGGAIAFKPSCAGIAKGDIWQTFNESVGCPSPGGVPSIVALTYEQSGTAPHACVAKPPLSASVLPAPDYPHLFNPVVQPCTTYNGSGPPPAQGRYQGLVITGSVTLTGLYEITGPAGSCGSSAEFDVQGGGTVVTMTNTTIWLDHPASPLTIYIHNKATVNWAPYQYTAADCPCPSTSDNHMALYSPPANPEPTPVDCKSGPKMSTAGEDLFNVQDNNTTFTGQGTFYIPNGGAITDSNASFVVNPGQFITNEWCVQSGNTTNPTIVFNPNAVSDEQEILALVQ